MKCCGSFLCQTCFDYALLRYGQCSFCSKSEHNFKNGSPNDTSVKMEICRDCDEEVPEKEFEAHKKCTKSLVSEYEDKLAQQRLELEKSHNLKMLKLELNNKLSLRKMATKARKLDDENDDLRKKSAAKKAIIKTLKVKKNLAENKIKKMRALIKTHEDAVLGIIRYHRRNRISGPKRILTGLQRSISEKVCNLQEENGILQTKTDKQRHEINKLRAKLGYIGGPRNHYG